MTPAHGAWEDRGYRHAARGDQLRGWLLALLAPPRELLFGRGASCG